MLLILFLPHCHRGAVKNRHSKWSYRQCCCGRIILWIHWPRGIFWSHPPWSYPPYWYHLHAYHLVEQHWWWQEQHYWWWYSWWSRWHCICTHVTWECIVSASPWKWLQDKNAGHQNQALQLTSFFMEIISLSCSWMNPFLTIEDT